MKNLLWLLATIWIISCGKQHSNFPDVFMFCCFIPSLIPLAIISLMVMFVLPFVVQYTLFNGMDDQFGGEFVCMYQCLS